MIIEGARQVGKTWLMKEFGKLAYEKTAYINFDSNPQMAELFNNDLNTDRIITGLSIYSDVKITPDDTLIIFDEVQEVPRALASLKYFCENAPQYHIICAGSLLGIALHEGTSFPVGKIDFLKLYPLSFKEFLLAFGKDKLVDLISGKAYDLIQPFRSELTELLKYYYFIGGMPEAVYSFSLEKDFEKVRRIQKRILEAYEQDFSKHAPTEVVPKLRMLWNSIPSQLAKENKKFIYGLVREGARAKDYEAAKAYITVDDELTEAESALADGISVCIVLITNILGQDTDRGILSRGQSVQLGHAALGQGKDACRPQTEIGGEPGLQQGLCGEVQGGGVRGLQAEGLLLDGEGIASFAVKGTDRQSQDGPVGGAVLIGAYDREGYARLLRDGGGHPIGGVTGDLVGIGGDDDPGGGVKGKANEGGLGFSLGLRHRGGCFFGVGGLR